MNPSIPTEPGRTAEHPAAGTATQLTPPGRGAVATIRFDGPCRLIDAAAPTVFRAANGKPLADQPIGRVVFGQWGREHLEDVVVCRIDELATEIHCHGGEAAVARILEDLKGLGCRIEAWPDWMERTAGIFEAEMARAVTRATTLRCVELLLEQQAGVLRTAIEELLATGEPARRQAGIDQLLRWADFGLHLTEPWHVVLAGRPNVGKSSLMNALLGFSRSIVFDQPGTTRDVVTGETAWEGWPVRLSDTAGLRGQADALESAGMDRARRQLATADCRLILLDTSRPPLNEDHQLLGEFPTAIVVAHKCDLPDVWQEALPHQAMKVSSVTREGLPELVERIVRTHVPHSPPAGTAIPVTRRQVQLLNHAREQLQDRSAACTVSLQRILDFAPAT